jgi:hypothetical protein
MLVRFSMHSRSEKALPSRVSFLSCRYGGAEASTNTARVDESVRRD